MNENEKVQRMIRDLAQRGSQVAAQFAKESDGDPALALQALAEQVVAAIDWLDAGLEPKNWIEDAIARGIYRRSEDA